MNKIYCKVMMFNLDLRIGVILSLSLQLTINIDFAFLSIPTVHSLNSIKEPKKSHIGQFDHKKHDLCYV